MEAPRGVEPTGTNGREATHIHTPGRRVAQDPAGPREGAQGARSSHAHDQSTATNRVHCPVPEPPHAGGKPRFPADNPRFAAAMAQERRPVPFRTRKLRPGTAMVLHPTGCGRVARRRTTRTGSPSEHTPQGAFPISETLTTQTHTPPQKHPGLLALMRPTSGTIPGRPRRRGRRETAWRVPISAGNPENSTSVTVESRRPGLLPPVCCADGSPP